MPRSRDPIDATQPTRRARRRVAPHSTHEREDEQLLTVREAAALLGLRPGTLYQWAYRRRIPIVKLFGRRGALRFRLRDVEKLIQDSLRPALPAESRPEPPTDNGRSS